MSPLAASCPSVFEGVLAESFTELLFSSAAAAVVACSQTSARWFSASFLPLSVRVVSSQFLQLSIISTTDPQISGNIFTRLSVSVSVFLHLIPGLVCLGVQAFWGLFCTPPIFPVSVFTCV